MDGWRFEFAQSFEESGGGMQVWEAGRESEYDGIREW